MTNDLFLVKGHYYAFSYDFYKIPLSDYGAIEGYARIKQSCSIFPYRNISADVRLFKSSGKWGLFPIASVLGMGCAEWASLDDNPFIYEDFRLVKRNDSTDSEFIILKRDGRWGAVKADLPNGVTPVFINGCVQFEFGTPDDVLHLIGEENLYTIDDDLGFEDCEESDFGSNPEESFMYGCCLHKDRRFFIDLVFGKYDYLPDMSAFESAARHNPYALFLIGKYLYDFGKGRIKNLKLSAFKSDKPDPIEVTFAYNDFRCAAEYMKLVKLYADVNELGTVYDFADYYLAELISPNLSLTSPDKPEYVEYNYQSEANQGKIRRLGSKR